MQLKTHCDTGDFSECSLRFHFFFALVRQKERQSLKGFDWDVTNTPKHRLYLSKDTTKLMEVINNFIGNVYYRVDCDFDGKSIRDQFRNAIRSKTSRTNDYG